MNNKKLTTFEQEMQNSEFRQEFEKEYKEFLLSEIVCALMDNDSKTVRGLAKEVGISPTIIQRLRSGAQDDVKLSNFVNLSHACGFNIFLEKGNEKFKL